MKPLVYVAGADPDVLAELDKVLTRGGYECQSFSDGQSLLAATKDRPPNLVMLDPVLPDSSGIEVLRKIRRVSPAPPVIMMADSVSATTAVRVLKLGATDFLELPRAPGHVLVAVRHALDSTDLRRQVEHLRNELQERHKMVGDSPAMRRVWKLIARVAPTSASVLITGESGSGKELVARAVHLQSPRAARPFVPLNCAAIPAELIESELFGHEKGAFTGAGAARMGKLQEADTGTLFLDEIGDLGLPAQAKLLRFLNDSEVQRVGGSGVLRLDVRVVAATNKDIQALVKQKHFRGDFYHRLNVVTIDVPPLRARTADIELIANYFLDQFRSDYDRSLDFTADSWRVLRSYDWPGNVRELRNLVERVVIMAETNPVEADELRSFLGAEAKVPTDGTLKVALERTERETVERVLAQTDNNVAEAAAILGIVRPSLYRIMKRYGLATPTQTRTSN
ncbi:sigma-54-dependent Fis family transcriptional regulator [candidate division WOR-3 bacterium]|nr:sigma-54-dependent Fis family transcriptional regulator [candidate division WOR-3 bacterium]